MNCTTIFYADNDQDDFMFFNDAVEKITSDLKDSIKLHLHLNGEHLLENLKNHNTQNGLVFLDINMPINSGFKLLENIRSNDDLKKIPVIMYSTSSNEADIEKSHNLGANFYVVKPYLFNDLIEMIVRITKINWENHRSDFENFIYLKH